MTSSKTTRGKILVRHVACHGQEHATIHEIQRTVNPKSDGGLDEPEIHLQSGQFPTRAPVEFSFTAARCDHVE